MKCHILRLLLVLIACPMVSAEADEQKQAFGLVLNNPDQSADPLPKGAVLRLGSARLRHPRTAAVAFTPDGKLVSFGGDYVVRVWDPANGRESYQRDLKVPPEDRHWRAGTLAADGRRVAAQLGDHYAVYDVGSGRELAAVKMSGPPFEGVARFSPDGNHLAVVDQQGVVRVCDVGANTSRDLAKLKLHSPDMAFSRDGKLLAVANFDAGAVVWDLPTGMELGRFQPTNRAGLAVDFDATGDVLLVLGPNPRPSVQFFRVSTGQPADGWTAPQVENTEWARFSPDGKVVLLGGREGVKGYNPKTGKEVRAAAGAAVVRPEVSPDGTLLASADNTRLRVWDVGTGKPFGPADPTESPRGEIHGVAVSSDGRWVATKEAETGTIWLWDVGGKPVAVIKSNRWGGRYPIFSPDAKHLYGSAPDGLAVVRWDLPGAGESARYIPVAAGDQPYISDFGLSADGRRLAAFVQPPHRITPMGGLSPVTAHLSVCDTETARRVEDRQVEARTFLSYGAFSPDLKWYFSGDRPLALAAAERGYALDMPVEWVARQAAVSPDGRLIAHAVEEPAGTDAEYRIDSRGVIVHEAATGNRVLVLPAERCGPIAFTPDGRGLVTTDPDTITRWDLVSKKRVAQHPAPGRFTGSYGHSFASSLAIAPSGDRVVTGHPDATALVWDLKAPSRGGEALSPQELSAAWDDLSGRDAERGIAAAWALADAPGDAVPFLRDRLKPAEAPPAERVRALIARLDSAAFVDRQAAEKELRALGSAAAPALRAAMKAGASGEQTWRVKNVLAAFASPVLPPGDGLRQMRAVAALEWAESAGARKLLRELAAGAAEDRLTEAANAAIERLDRRSR
jgi:WD40 repeat protein